ncbi:hypothetical protein V1289_003693 [Bradyrhizobium sp. AZCC 2289]
MRRIFKSRFGISAIRFCMGEGRCGDSSGGSKRRRVQSPIGHLGVMQLLFGLLMFLSSCTSVVDIVTQIMEGFPTPEIPKTSTTPILEKLGLFKEGRSLMADIHERLRRTEIFHHVGRVYVLCKWSDSTNFEGIGLRSSAEIAIVVFL